MVGHQDGALRGTLRRRRPLGHTAGGARYATRAVPWPLLTGNEASLGGILFGRVLLLIVGVALLCACEAPRVTRPLDGAPARGSTTTPGAVVTLEPAAPPTLTGAAGLQGGGPTTSGGPSPSPVVLASPSPLPGPPWVIAATGGRGANMREQPSTTARVIVTLAEGTPVELLGQPTTVDGQAWRQVRANGRDGWIVSGAVHAR